MTFSKVVLGGAAIAGLAAAALAHSGATGVVKERMDAMEAMSEAIKRIRPMMTGESSYDAAALRAAAETIASEAGATMTEKFPEGSGGHPSETLPRTWEEWDRFTALAEQLEMAATGLGLAAENGLHVDGHMMGAQSGMMGDQSGMMGGGMMMGERFPQAMTAERIGQMPAYAPS
ncbi:MAG: cytochrome c [Roseovarius sp.]